MQLTGASPLSPPEPGAGSDNEDDDDEGDGSYLHPSLFASRKCDRLEELMKVVPAPQPELLRMWCQRALGEPPSPGGLCLSLSSLSSALHFFCSG